jgi:hypothetical protein
MHMISAKHQFSSSRLTIEDQHMPIKLIAQHLPQNHTTIQTLLAMIIILSQNGCICKLYNHFM